jgi:hypothetical protein
MRIPAPAVARRRVGGRTHGRTGHGVASVSVAHGVAADTHTENGNRAAGTQQTKSPRPPRGTRNRHSRRAPMSRLHSTFETVDSTLILA